VLSFHREILSADGVILASPVYVNDVSGAVKTLIDRLAFVCHRPAYAETPFFLLATTGGSPTTHTLRSMQSAVVSWGAPLIGSLGLKAGALSTREQMEEQYGRLLEKKAAKIIDYFRSGAAVKPSFISLTVFAVQQYSWRQVFEVEGYDSPDAHYWSENGWLERRTTYFFPHRAFLFKTTLARMIGRAAALFT
jgi:hypothetical protein